MLFWNSPTYVFVIFYNVTIPHLLSQKLDFKYIVLYLTSNHTELCPDVKFGPKCIAVVAVLQSICLVCPLTSMLTNTNSQYFTYLIFGMVNDPTLNINPIDCKQTTPVLYTCLCDIRFFYHVLIIVAQLMITSFFHFSLMVRG